jgi:hypothetical protein
MPKWVYQHRKGHPSLPRFNLAPQRSLASGAKLQAATVRACRRSGRVFFPEDAQQQMLDPYIWNIVQQQGGANELLETTNSSRRLRA